MELSNLIQKHTGKRALMKQMSEQSGEVKLTYANIEKAQKILGYRPMTGIEKGIEKFVDWYTRWR